MSFLKGPRFDPQKGTLFSNHDLSGSVFTLCLPPSVARAVSDVPPVGSYNPKLVESEAFIRGGFIEKSDRFKGERIRTVPPRQARRS
jgi:hypothetical protein